MEKAGIDARGYWGSDCAMFQPLLGIDVLVSPQASLAEQAAFKGIRDLLAKLGGGIEMAYFPLQVPACNTFSGLALPDPQRPPMKHWANIKIVIGAKPPAMLGRPTVYDANRLVTPPKK